MDKRKDATFNFYNVIMFNSIISEHSLPLFRLDSLELSSPKRT